MIISGSIKDMIKKAKSGEIYEFDPVIYPYRIWVVIAEEPNIIAEKFYEYDGAEMKFVEQDGTNRCLAFVIPVKDKEEKYYGSVLYFRSKDSMTMELIAHESTHAAKYLFEHINAEMKHHEPFEYVVGWIADCCDKVKQGLIK